VTLRWGLLGTARINRRVIPAILASPRSTIAAVGSRDAARAAAYAREWAIPASYASYDALLDSPIDIVYNALPNSLHVPWTLKAVAAGKHVLCEKPLALHPRDVDAVSKATRHTDVIVTEGFMYRHHAQTAAIRDTVARGTLGGVRVIASSFSYLRDRQGDVRLDPALGGGALWDVGCYPVSIALLLAGPAAEVTGIQRLGPTGVDEEFCAALHHESGVLSQVSASFAATFQAYLRIVGTRGTMTVAHPFRPGQTEHLHLERDERAETLTVQGNASFVDEVTDMEDAVLGLKAPALSLAESRVHAATLVAMYDSARTGAHVRLS
jgi:xylose dehydrogenase (NAD/NADP)